VIGHMKQDGHLERNHLKGAEGDAINAILTAAGHNLRLLARWLRLLLFIFLAALIQIQARQSISQVKQATA
jgi:IS5 family transposase